MADRYAVILLSRIGLSTLLYKKISLISAFLTLLSGCGFQPMLQTDASGKQPFTLAIKGDGYPTYIFRREMEKQLALIPRLNDKDYRIDVTVTGSQVAGAIAQDATISRVNLSYSATYKISQKEGNSTQQTSRVTSSYPVVPRDEFVSRNADMDATSRIMISLAQEVALEIIRDIKQDVEKKPKI